MKIIPISLDNKSKNQTALMLLLVGVFFMLPLSAKVANLLMLIAFATWLTTGDWVVKWKNIKTNPGLCFALGLYGWMWLGVIYSPANTDHIQLHLVKYFKLACMAVIVTSLSNDIWRKRAWWGFGFALALTVISTYLNIWWELPWSVTNNQGWSNDHTVFKDYISQGILISMFTAICLAQTIKIGNTLPLKLAWGAAALLSALTITHLSAGRSGYLALFVALVFFAFWANRGWRRWWVLFFVCITAGVMYFSSSVMQSRVSQAIDEARNHSIEDLSSIGQRLYFAKKTVELIKEKPLLGWGTGAYHEQFCRVADNDTWCQHGSFHPHNQYLFIWVEHGLVGLILMLGMIVTPLWITRNAPGHIRGIAAAYSGIFIVISMTHASLWLSTESHFHILFGALILAGYKKN